MPRKSGASDNAKLAELFRKGPRNGDVSTDVVTVVTNRPILNIGIPPVFYSINYFVTLKMALSARKRCLLCNLLMFYLIIVI
jgi:hypothetical protein